jgi:hypothetical protein
MSRFTTPATSSSEDDVLEADGGEDEGGNAEAGSGSMKKRPRRDARPNPRYHCPDWAAQEEGLIANVN